MHGFLKHIMTNDHYVIFFFEGLGSVSCNGFIAIIKPGKGHIIICCEETYDGFKLVFLFSFHG